MQEIVKLYKKYKEIINYLIFGVLTTLVSIVTYWLFSEVLSIQYIVSNVLSWILAVTFAFVTNRIWVFESKNKNYFQETMKFFMSRLMTLVLELAFMYLFVDVIHVDNMLSKLICQVIVIVLNYVLSKLFVFKRESN